MLVPGIIYHLQFMYGLRVERDQMTTQGLIYGQSHFPVSPTLVVAIILLVIGIFAILCMVFHVGPFG